MKELTAALAMTVAVATGLFIMVSIGGDDGGAETTQAQGRTPPPTQATSTPSPSESVSAAELGESLSTSIGCRGCHSTTGETGVGPTWLALFGSERPLADGTTVTADEAYLHESIVNPNAKTVGGFGPNVMTQSYGDILATSRSKL